MQSPMIISTQEMVARAAERILRVFAASMQLSDGAVIDVNACGEQKARIESALTPAVEHWLAVNEPAEHEAPERDDSCYLESGSVAESVESAILAGWNTINFLSPRSSGDLHMELEVRMTEQIEDVLRELCEGQAVGVSVCASDSPRGPRVG